MNKSLLEVVEDLKLNVLDAGDPLIVQAEAEAVLDPYEVISSTGHSSRDFGNSSWRIYLFLFFFFIVGGVR